MKRLFATNLIFLLLINAVVKPLWIFGIDRNVQIALGAREYGIFFTMFNFSLFLNFILDMGITNFNNREISYHPVMVSRQFINIAIIKLVLTFFYLAFTFSLAFVLNFDSRSMKLLLMLVVNQIIATFLMFVRSNLNGLHLFRADSILSILDKALLIIFLYFILWGSLPINFTVEVFAFCQTAAYAATLLVAVIILIKNYNGRFSIKFDKLIALTLFKRGLPFAILVLLMTLYSRLDTVLIERLTPERSVSAGIYAQAFRLFDAFNMYPYLFASLMLPIYSRMMRKKENLSDFFNFSLHLMMVPVLVISISSVLFAKPIVELLYREHLQETQNILMILMGSFFFVSLGYLFGTSLTAHGNIWLLCKVSAAVVVVNFLGQLYVIPRFGITGAAVCNLIANLLAATLQGFFMFKILRINLVIKQLVKLTFFAISQLTIILLLPLFLGATIKGFVTALLISVVLVFGIRLVTTETILRFIKQN